MPKVEMKCNKCGKNIKVVEGTAREGVFECRYEWGYFSQKDLQIHQFNMCEDCYDEMVNSFVIPIKVSEKNEVLS